MTPSSGYGQVERVTHSMSFDEPVVGIPPDRHPYRSPLIIASDLL